MVKSTLEILNKLMRSEKLQEGEKASLCRVSEVNDILKLFKTDAKRAASEMDRYRNDLKARLEASEQPAPKRQRVEPSVPQSDAPKAHLLPPPSTLPPNDFSTNWTRHFMQQMCSKIHFFSPSSLPPVPERRIVEEAEEQRIFVDGLTNQEVQLLLKFIFDMQQHIRTKDSIANFTVPSKLGLLNKMTDPLESRLLDSWYFSIPSQCATCALRFGSRRLLTTHHDYHFVKNAASGRRKKGLDVAFRGWNENPQEFLGNRGVLITRSFFRRLDQASTAVEESNVKSAKDAAGDFSLSSAVPANDIKKCCAECGEPFNRIWSDAANMSVFPSTVCIPLLGSEPVRFAWPDSEASVGAVDAARAADERRVENSLFFHECCWEMNPKLKEADAQLALLDALEQAEELVELDKIGFTIVEEEIEEEVEDLVTQKVDRKYF